VNDGGSGRIRRAASGRFAGATGWAAAAVAVSAATGVLTARGLGPEYRGTLALALSIAGFCVLISAFGTNVSVRRHLPRNAGVTIRGYERLSILLTAPLLIVLASAGYATASFVDPSFGRWDVGAAFMVYGVGFYFSNQALDLLNAAGLVVKSARTNAIGSLFCLALVSIATASGLGLPVIILAYATSTFFQSAMAYSILTSGVRTRRQQAVGLRTLLKDGGRLLGLNLGQTVAYRADTVLLGVFSGQSEVGMYAVATTPAAVLRIPSNALGQAAFHDAASGDIAIRKILGRLARLLVVMVPLVAVGWVLADWAVVLIYGVAYADAADILRVLLLAEIALAPFLVIARVVAGLGSTWGASASGISGAIVLIFACGALIPPLGAVGAAWASVAAYFTMSSVASLALLGAHRSSRNGGT